MIGMLQVHRYVPSPHMDAPECDSNIVLGKLLLFMNGERLLRDRGAIGSSTQNLPLGQGGNSRLSAGYWRKTWRLLSVCWSLCFLQKSASAIL